MVANQAEDLLLAEHTAEPEVKKPAEFITSDGRRISFYKGYFELNKPYPFGHETMRAYLDAGQQTYPKTDAFFYSKLMAANVVEDWLRDHVRPLPKGGATLDLCSGPAIIPRALKARGLCDVAEASDLTPRGDDYSDERIAHLWALSPVVREKNLVKHCTLFTGSPSPYTYLTEPRDASRISLDAYYDEDFLTQDFGDKRYNIMTLISGIEYFDVDKCLEKIATLLNPGGVFCTHNRNFYDVLGGALYAQMDAPAMHTQVTKADFLRYYAEHHPDMAEDVKKVYFHKTPHLVMDDYVDLAAKHGLETVFSNRVISVSTREMLYNSAAFYKNLVTDILPSARYINPRVSLRDYFTSYFTFIFRKPA